MTDPIDAFSTRLASPVGAKQAILIALTATKASLSTAQLRLCGQLFGAEGPAVRVALGRLVDKGDVLAEGDGVYRIGDKGQAFFDALQRWRDLPRLDKPWRGGWIAMHTAHLGRSDRPQLRARQRALSLFGFATAAEGLWVRPDNLRIEPELLLKRLRDLGLGSGALLLSGARFVQEPEPGVESLWDRETLEAGYAAAEVAMQTCLEAFEGRSAQERARDTATIGAAVIGMLAFDPLLPAELVDAELRRNVHRRMLYFDRMGRQALTAFWREHGI